MDLTVAVAAGFLVGTLTGLLPGLHVNTLAAVAFAAWPNAGIVGGAFLLAVGTVHTIVNILPATYLGAPDADDVVGVLPAHRLLLQGRASEAVGVSVAASLVGIAVGVAVSFAVQPTWEVLTRVLDAWTVPLLAGVVAALALQELRRGWQKVPLALLVSVMAGGVGWGSTQLSLTPLVDVPPSPLLPLLGGLFGAAGLTFALQRPPVIPTQQPFDSVARRTGVALTGSLMAGVTAWMPGLTSAVATAFVPGIRGRPLHAVASMSAINSAHAVLALGAWMMSGRIRTGLADALSHWMPTTWHSHRPDVSVATLLMILLIAALLGALATVALNGWMRRHAHRLPSRSLAFAGLAFLAALTALLTGWVGVMLGGLATAVGRLPVHFGVRRVHLVGCLILPIMMWQ